MKKDQVVLVNETDEQIGVMAKIEAHKKGLLHRAFSVFIFDSKGRMLLQQRAAEKYHGAHLWTNACCSHPGPDENVKEAAQRRLDQEMGFTTELQEIFSFIYKAEVENNLVEYEFDYVFVGEYENEIKPHPAEVSAFYYENMEQLKTKIETHPLKFTAWFKIAFPQIENWWKERYGTKRSIFESKSEK
jgi:isopentenyl-diphosphate Delta-isomerase